MIYYNCPQLIQSILYKEMELVKRGMNVQAPKDFVATFTVLMYDSCCSTMCLSGGREKGLIWPII